IESGTAQQRWWRTVCQAGCSGGRSEGASGCGVPQQACGAQQDQARRTEEGTPVTPAAAGGRKWSVRRYLVAGILIWLPILATLWVVTFFIHIMDETLLLLPLRYRPEALVGFALPGLGAVFAFLVVLATGLLVTNLIGRQLVAFSEGLLNRIPVVRSVYGGVKSFAESVCSQSNSSRK